MIRSLFALLLLAFLSCASAQEQAFANRSTDLLERGAPDARAKAQLREGAEVRVLERAGGFARVDSPAGQGWVRVFHLRFPAVTSSSKADTGTTILSSAANAISGRSRTQEATIATTGVRGLDKEALQNASPNPQAVRQMQGFRADRQAAERFAREGKLAETQVDDDGGRR